MRNLVALTPRSTEAGPKSAEACRIWPTPRDMQGLIWAEVGFAPCRPSPGQPSPKYGKLCSPSRASMWSRSGNHMPILTEVAQTLFLPDPWTSRKIFPPPLDVAKT